MLKSYDPECYNARYLHATCTQLLKKSLIYINELHEWLGKSINPASKISTGNHGRPLSTYGTFEYDLALRGGRLHAIIAAVWISDAPATKHADVGAALELFHGLQLIEPVTSQPQDYLQAVIAVDIEKWPKVALAMLWPVAADMLVNEYGNSTVSDTAKEHARLILEHLYPGLAMERIKLAADLGLFDDGNSFAAWVGTHSAQKEVQSIQPPTDLDIC